MADERDLSVSHFVSTRRFVSPRVDEAPSIESESGAVGQHLIEIGVGEAARLLSLVLGVHHGNWTAPHPPDEIRAQLHALCDVEVVLTVLQTHRSAVPRERVAQGDADEVLEYPRHVEQEPAREEGAARLLERARREHDLGQPQGHVVAGV